MFYKIAWVSDVKIGYTLFFDFDRQTVPYKKKFQNDTHEPSQIFFIVF